MLKSNQISLGETTHLSATDFSLEMSLQGHFENLEDKCNKQIADGLKKGLRLIVEKLNSSVQKKLKDLIRDEIRDAMVKHEKKWHLPQTSHKDAKQYESPLGLSRVNLGESAELSEFKVLEI